MNTSEVIMAVGYFALIIVFWSDYYRTNRRTHEIAKHELRKAKGGK